MFIRSGSFKDWLADFKKDTQPDNEITKQLSDELHIMQNVINQGGLRFMSKVPSTSISPTFNSILS